jgi:hypothetical protein
LLFDGEAWGELLSPITSRAHNFFLGGSYPVNNERAMLAQEGIRQWTPLTDAHGYKLGNPATAVVGAGANALYQAGTMVGPMGEEKAAVTTLKEVEKVVPEVEKETYEIIDGVRRSKAADLVGHDTIPAQILNSEGKVVGTKDISVNQLLSPKSSIDVSTPTSMDRFMSTLNKTKAGSTPPPILVQPGSRGVPIKNVPLDPIGGH